MRKVTTINLNNNAYQIDEEGYEALRAYLALAEQNLAGNPDRAEILSDLEQAIGDKCRASLGPHKTVVNVADIERILAEMGPVEGPAPAAGEARSESGPGGAAASPFPRRMYRLNEGRVWAGVCTGMAAYFGVDVVWMRLLFILLTLFTSGIWILVYIALSFVVPTAETAEERAAARGAPFNARELVGHFKKKAPEALRPRTARVNWGPWREPREPAPGGASPGYAARITGGLLLPVLTVLSAAWFVAMLLGGLAIWGAWGSFGVEPWQHYGYPWPHELPRWVPLVALVVAWSLIAIPLAAGRRASLYYANGGRRHGWADFWSGLLWVALVWALLIVAWQLLPGIQDFVRDLLNGQRVNVSFV